MLGIKQNAENQPELQALEINTKLSKIVYE